MYQSHIPKNICTKIDLICTKLVLKLTTPLYQNSSAPKATQPVRISRVSRVRVNVRFSFSSADLCEVILQLNISSC